MTAEVISVSLDSGHLFSKKRQESIRLVRGLGVEGDAHFGEKVQHLYFQKIDPQRPNLRQVHLIQAELFAEVAEKGFTVYPGELGENITTRGVDLIRLPLRTRLRIGEAVEVEVTGTRKPCHQINTYQAGLQTEMIGYEPDGSLIYKTGVMAIILKGGIVRPGDEIKVMLPPEPHEKLQAV